MTDKFWIIAGVLVVLGAAVLAGQDLIEGRLVDMFAGILLGGTGTAAFIKKGN